MFQVMQILSRRPRIPNQAVLYFIKVHPGGGLRAVRMD